MRTTRKQARETYWKFHFAKELTFCTLIVYIQIHGHNIHTTPHTPHTYTHSSVRSLDARTKFIDTIKSRFISLRPLSFFPDLSLYRRVIVWLPLLVMHMCVCVCFCLYRMMCIVYAYGLNDNVIAWIFMLFLFVRFSFSLASISRHCPLTFANTHKHKHIFRASLVRLVLHMVEHIESMKEEK